MTTLKKTTLDQLNVNFNIETDAIDELLEIFPKEQLLVSQYSSGDHGFDVLLLQLESSGQVKWIGSWGRDHWDNDPTPSEFNYTQDYPNSWQEGLSKWSSVPDAHRYIGASISPLFKDVDIDPYNLN